MPFDPLDSPTFILGMHRSGTTLLYEMLARSGCWNTLWAWHVTAYDEIEPANADLEESKARLSRRFADAGLETRGVDSIRVSIETMEEYGFILDNRGQGPRITRKNFPLFQGICRTVQRTFSEPKPLLLKNPWDFGNAPLIRELMQSARLVYIHRSPIEVVNSMWKFLRGVFTEKNEYMTMLSTQYERLTRTRVRIGALRWVIKHQPMIFVKGLIRWFAKSCDLYLKTATQIAERDRIEVTYDQLCSAPDSTIAAILEHCGVHGADVDYSSMIERRTGKIDELVAAQSAAIERRFAAYLRQISEIGNRPLQLHG
jgi:hypothetical protein